VAVVTHANCARNQRQFPKITSNMPLVRNRFKPEPFSICKVLLWWWAIQALMSGYGCMNASEPREQDHSSESTWTLVFRNPPATDCAI
jgi:hypothetical protein